MCPIFHKLAAFEKVAYTMLFHGCNLDLFPQKLFGGNHIHIKRIELQLQFCYCSVSDFPIFFNVKDIDGTDLGDKLNFRVVSVLDEQLIELFCKLLTFFPNCFSCNKSHFDNLLKLIKWVE